MHKKRQWVIGFIKIVFGCALFGIAFNMFFAPIGLNAGGVSGLGMIFVKFFEVGTVGSVTAVINIPLFALAAFLLGRKFFVGSLIGMLAIAVSIDSFAFLPAVDIDPLMCALYGGILAGGGLGLVFASGASTGGSDIIVRILKLRWPNIRIGVICTGFDLIIAALTGVVFNDVSCALYSGVAIFITGRVIDIVVYRFDYSKVVLIISDKHQEVAEQIALQLHRGATFLNGQGSYTGNEKKVILTAVKRQQLAELKSLVVAIDSQAFVIVQEAHQVLGDGFSRYSKDSL
ncbi:MAG: YitT family protein [Ruminococcaceae bacterium]|nr:YitT family protein [Oscillospiraceae bacterium]